MTKYFVNNRQEIKYLVGAQEAKKFQENISDLLIADSQNDRQDYPVYSVYFDSPQFTFYKEQIDGLSTRSKPRLRMYQINSKTPSLVIFLEFKHRCEDLIAKERTSLNAAQANNLLKGKDFCDNIDNEDTVLERFRELTKRLGLTASVGVLYQRKAFSSPVEECFRVTIDTQIKFTKSRDLVPSLEAFQTNESGDCAVIELKYVTHVPKRIIQMAKRMKLKQTSYSKYVRAVEQVYDTPIL